MDVNQALALLGDLSPQLFMKRYWQKKPLLVRQAIRNFSPLLDRTELFELASDEDAQARLVIQNLDDPAKGWQFKHGPFERRALPPMKRAGWTLLLQGVDLQHDAVHALMNQFRFIPDGRLDDLMISYATDGGGVGPHFDSYDVFLLQAHGRRRWRIGRQKDLSLQPDVPLKILANFVPDQEFVLEPGDMLYLPPRYAHDGVAEGECMTYSIGFRSPNRGELARELLQRLADDAEDAVGAALYRDPAQLAVDQPGEIPSQMIEFASEALKDALKDPEALGRAMGEYLTEPKASVWFETHGSGDERTEAGSHALVRLDRRSKMMFDAKHIFINGESFRASGRDATILRRLSNERVISRKDFDQTSSGAKSLMLAWQSSGWINGI